MADSWNEKTVFLAALRMRAEDRAAYLDGACPDATSRARIEELLRHAGEPDTVEEAADFPFPATAVPNRIDEFKILSRLGEGGMGVVYLAEDVVLGRQVALKLLAPLYAYSPAALARFRQEARSAATLNHPAIVPVYKLGFDGSQHYMASEYVEGPTLAARIVQEREQAAASELSSQVRDWHEFAANVVAAIADALDFAHQRRIIHRDVKPSNILLDPVRGPRLTDFGIAKVLGDEGGTEKTALIGSCHYMSPEQASTASVKIDRRSDVFSLGVVLYEMLALRRPFDGTTQSEVLRSVLETDPPNLRSLKRRIPPDLAVICHKALEKLVEDRYQSAAHVAADLRSYLAGNAILATAPSPWVRLRRFIRRHHRGIVGTAAAAAISIAVFATWGLQQERAEKHAWVSVAGGANDLIITAERVRPDTFEMEPVPIAANRLPLRQLNLMPGCYRFVVVSTRDGSSAEIDVAMLQPGSSFETEIRVLPWNQRDLPASERSWVQEGPRRYHAWLATDDQVGSEMVEIPGGTYHYGAVENGGPNIGKRQSHVAPFRVDRFEVSNQEYKSFVDATGYSPPEHWTLYGYDPALANHPVVGVLPEDCSAYARWVGKRLLTAVEWQAAARGPEGRLYPWGNSIEAAPAVAYERPPFGATQSRVDRDHYDYYKKYTVTVDRPSEFENTTALFHVYGNVREITSTRTAAGGVIVMGRCWAEVPEFMTLANSGTRPAGTCDYQDGFRCARSVKPPTPKP